jgi:hypothetical protein
MRKFMLAAVLAVLGAAVLATPASAFDHHFTVVAKPRSSHGVGHNAFVFKDRLFDPHNRHDKVGRDRGKCRSKHGNKLKCHLRVHLNGEIGGFGDIRVKGDLDSGPDHLVVTGGSDDFDGVAGKLTVHNTKKEDVLKYRFDLVR